MTPTKMARVPNQPKTPMRSFRCEESLWERVRAYAIEHEVSQTAVVVKALRQFFGVEDR